MQSRKLSLIHLVLLLCLSVFAFSTHSAASQKDGLLKIYFFNVGQGDSIFIETPSGHQILIDGGPGGKVLSKLGGVMPFYDKNINLVVMTHPDADHASGLVEVLEKYEVENVVFSDIESEKALYLAWKELVEKEGANIIDPILGKIIDLGDGVILHIIYPSESLTGQRFDKTNNNSIVAMLDYKDLEVLLTGDIEVKGERAILIEGVDVDADILKIAHHGSKTSSMEEFLSAVSPEVAVIQVGAENRYSHPTEEVLKRLDDFGIKYYRNDLDGDIKITSDGNSFIIN